MAVIVTICLAFLLFLMYMYSLNFPACQGSYPHHAFQLLHGPALTLLLSVIWLLLLIHASKPCSSLLDASSHHCTWTGGTWNVLQLDEQVEQNSVHIEGKELYHQNEDTSDEINNEDRSS